MNLIIFVILSAAKVISAKLTDLESVEKQTDVIGADADIKSVKFKHPYFVSLVGYLGEFLVVAGIYIYYSLKDPQKIPQT